MKRKTHVKEHHLNRKGYFPLGAVVDSQGAREAFQKEIHCIREVPRLETHEGTANKTVTMDFIRDTLLRLHTLEEYGNVDDDRKNLNNSIISLGVGSVVSKYSLPISEIEIAVVTTFKPDLLTGSTEVLTTVMLWEEYN